MNINLKGTGNVTIDGKSFTGGNIQINGNKVIVDGVVQDGELIGDIKVTVHGDVERLQTGSGRVFAQGVGIIQTGSGDVKCGNVSGSVQTGSGDVKCENVSGSIKTGSGDVYHR